MITFTELGKMGRLGNQLFQYAALRSLSLKKNYECKIPNPELVSWHGQKCLLNKFNIKTKFLSDEDYSRIKFNYIENDIDRFDTDFFHLGDGVNLVGFFQSYRYFENFQKEIVDELTPKQNYMSKMRREIEQYKGNHELVSIHVRRGDNQDGTNPEYANFYGVGDVMTPDSQYGRYLSKAKEVFANKKVKYLIFTGGSRKINSSNLSDIEWCKDNINGEDILYSENKTDFEDFCLMSLCDHNIICHLSSFGYWAAMINKNKNKVIVAPSNYTLSNSSRVLNGFYPKEWVIV